jgi:hypothetical protein
VVARHGVPPAGYGRNIRHFRANQGKARRSGTFFPDRIVCFPRSHDMPALTRGQRNQRKAWHIGSIPQAVVALSSRRPRRLWISSHGAFLSRAAPCGAPWCQSRTDAERFRGAMAGEQPAGPRKGCWTPCAECLRAAQPVLIYAPSRSTPECRLPKRNFL